MSEIASIYTCLNSLPNDKILGQSKFKAFADDKMKVQKKKIIIMKFVKEREETIVGKGENAGYQHFLLFSQCFQKDFIPRVVGSRDCVVKD